MTRRFDLRTITALEHQLTETFGSPERFGVKMPLPPGLMADSGKVVLTIVAADGRVSERERQTFLTIMRAYGASEEDIRAVGAFTPDNRMLDTLVEQGSPPFLRCLVYDAIRIARVDGFHQKERETTERVVKKLGLEPGLVAAIEALVHVEDAVTMSRNRLLDPPLQLPEGWEAAPDKAGQEARAREFGASGMVQLPRDFHVAMCKAIFGIAAADRDLSEAELRWYAGYAKTMGSPEDAFEEAMKIDYQSTPFEHVFDTRLRPYARVAMYVALKGARVDGVSEREQDMARRAASRFGLDQTFVTALLGQLDVEAALREARVGLLAPLR